MLEKPSLFFYIRCILYDSQTTKIAIAEIKNHIYVKQIHHKHQCSHYEERDQAHAPCRTPQVLCGV